MGGSHAAWANGLKEHSRHRIEIMGLPARHWKWRMHGAAIGMARQFSALPYRPDLILASDMLDLSAFLGLTRNETQGIPIGIYFHENQLTYPWSPTDEDVQLKRDNHYAFINYTSALAANRVFFNSHYHRESFLSALPHFLKAFPDDTHLDTIQLLRDKSEVLHLGMDLSTPTPETKAIRRDPEVPLLLWNHRWEYDKGPEEFFTTLFELQEEGLDFQLAVVGQSYARKPGIFQITKQPKMLQYAQHLFIGFLGVSIR